MTRNTLFAVWSTGRALLVVSLACVALVATVGCNRVEPPRFRLNFEGLDLAGEKTAEERETEQANEQKIANLLTAAFGTPDEPYVFPETGLDLKKLQLAAGASYSDQKGYQRGLYRKNCAHCHGVTGDGAGPTALFLNPYPRDYRQGKFKFTSTNAETFKPTTADLKHTINEGFVGTAMPSFKLLPGYEVDALIEYVKYLSIRGETELLLRYLIANEEPLPNDRAALLEQVIQPVEAWKAAEDAVLVPNQENLPPLDATADPAAYAASIERGRLLFRDGKTANCVKCHGLNGLGDGGGDALYDDWNKEKPVHPDYAWLLPVQQLHPRNLRLGLYRGGRRPADIYRRISAGIKGTPMPAAGKVLTQPGQIWDIVNYVLSLPYEDEAHASHAEDHATASRGQL